MDSTKFLAGFIGKTVKICLVLISIFLHFLWNPCYLNHDQNFTLIHCLHICYRQNWNPVKFGICLGKIGIGLEINSYKENNQDLSYITNFNTTKSFSFGHFIITSQNTLFYSPIFLQQPRCEWHFLERKTPSFFLHENCFETHLPLQSQVRPIADART
jgi:hypothetical protein